LGGPPLRCVLDGIADMAAKHPGVKHTPSSGRGTSASRCAGMPRRPASSFIGANRAAASRNASWVPARARTATRPQPSRSRPITAEGPQVSELPARSGAVWRVCGGWYGRVVKWPRRHLRWRVRGSWWGPGVGGHFQCSSSRIVLGTRKPTSRARVDPAGGGLFGDLAARGGSATHGRPLRYTGRAAGPVNSLFDNISARQKLFWTVKLTDSGVGGENGEPLWGYGPHPGHPPCVTYIY